MKNMCAHLLLGVIVYKCQLGQSGWLTELLQVFYPLTVLSVCSMNYWKRSAEVSKYELDLFSCPFSSLHVYFMYFKAICCGGIDISNFAILWVNWPLCFSLWGEGWGINAGLPIFFGFILLFSCCLLKLNTKLIQGGRWNVIP